MASIANCIIPIRYKDVVMQNIPVCGTLSFLQVLDSIYFSRRFHVRCVAKAVDKVGHVGTPLRSNVVTIGTDSAICHTPVVAGTARGFQAQSFIATLKYLDVKHKEHPNRSGVDFNSPYVFFSWDGSVKDASVKLNSGN